MTFALPSSPHWAPTTTVTGTTGNATRGGGPGVPARSSRARGTVTVVSACDADPAVGGHGRPRPRRAVRPRPRRHLRPGAPRVDRGADRRRPRPRRRRGVRCAGQVRRDRARAGAAPRHRRRDRRRRREHGRRRRARRRHRPRPCVQRGASSPGSGRGPSSPSPDSSSARSSRRWRRSACSCRRARRATRAWRTNWPRRPWSPASPRIALVVPPVPGGAGEVDPAVLVVCRKLGITDVFRVNGPAGIAALGIRHRDDPEGAHGGRTRARRRSPSRRSRCSATASRR